MHKKILTIFIAINLSSYATCSDIRDYFPKKSEPLNNLQLFRSGKKLEQTVKKEQSRRIAIETSLAQACLKINEQGDQIKLQQEHINTLQTAVQLLARKHHDQYFDVCILTDDVDEIMNDMANYNDKIETFRSNIIDLTEKVSELSDFKNEVTTIRDNFDDLQENLSELDNKLETLKSNISESSSSKEELNTRIDQLRDTINDVRNAIIKSSPQKRPKSPEISFDSNKRTKY